MCKASSLQWPPCSIKFGQGWHLAGSPDALHDRHAQLVAPLLASGPQDENWRMCYKALLLLEHLLKHGPGKIVGDVQVGGQ